MPVSRRSSLARLLVTSAVSVAAITALAGTAATAGTGGATTRPSVGGHIAGKYGPQDVDKKKKNVNVTNKAGPQSETTVAVNPTNPNNMLAASNDLTGTLTTHVYETTDGGKHWSLVTTGISGFCYDPWLHFNDVGDAFFAYECSDQRYAYRLHGTSNWVLTTFTPGQAGNGPDRDMIITDDTSSSPFYHSAYIGYDDASAGNAAYVLYSRDSKTGWARSPKINDAGTVIGVNVSVAADGTVYASWLDYPSSRIMVDKSTNGGKTWGTDHLVHSMVMSTAGFFILIPPTPHRGIVPMPFTKAALGGAHAGRLYETYEDRKSGGGSDTNVYVTFSDNGGTTWSTPAQVNDDNGTAYQFFPAIAIDPAGTVGLSWYDTRNDPLNHKTDQYFSFSTDGGGTWSANKKVTTKQSDESGSGANGNDYGDYEGLDSNQVGIFAEIWTDSRPGTLNEDMFFGKVKAK
jgi:hypothetical protein